ncbi:hypothetical protein AFB00_21315 [Pseudonocardia sp. HH130630-07]|nr:hypothetical protein AFB00_21315 [Pseudonocardia sp. HH130630-07]
MADTDGAVLDPAEPAAELARIQQTGDQAGPSRILSSTVALMIRIEEALDSSRGADRSLLLRSGAQVAEFAGFVCRDAGQDVECASWHARALEYALRADDSAIQAYVLLRKAQAVYDRRATHLMSDLVAAAERAGTGAGPGLRAEILQQRARCEAMLGARSGDVRRMLDRAAAVAAEQPDRNDPALQHDEALFGIQIAICLCEAGRPRDAFHQYRSVDTRSLSQRDQAYVSILTARALALSGEPDEAAVMAQQSVPIAAAAGSRRSLGEARRLARTLEPWRSRHAVQDLGHVLRSASELLHR